MLSKIRVLWWLGIICFMTALFPTIHHEILPNGTKDSLTIGLPSSPWVTAYRSETKEESKQESKTENSTSMQMSFSIQFEQDFSVDLISWSALVAVAGMAFIAVSGKRRRTTHDSSTPQPAASGTK